MGSLDKLQARLPGFNRLNRLAVMVQELVYRQQLVRFEVFDMALVVKSLDLGHKNLLHLRTVHLDDSNTWWEARFYLVPNHIELG